jgi:hypothetical protein
MCDVPSMAVFCKESIIIIITWDGYYELQTTYFIYF